MAVETIEQIKAKISAFENAVPFLQVRTRWEEDYDKYTLEPYKPAKGFYAYTSNSARVYCKKLISMLVKAKLMIRVPLETLREDEREIANNIERYIYGALNLNDERLLKIPDTPSIRQQRAFYAVVRGGFARCAYVHKNEKGETIPLVYNWDLYNLRYGRDGSGTAWAAYVSRITKDECLRRWGKKITADDVEQIDYWTDEVNGVYLGDDWVKKQTPHNLGYNPVTIHRAGADPRIAEVADQTVNKNIGESAIKDIRDIYPITNQVISDLVTIVHRGVKAPMKEITATGESKINEDVFGTDKAAVVTYKTGENLEPLQAPSMPQDAAQLLGFLSGEMQRGSLPFTAYGELGFRLSGFAINQLQGSMETIIEPFLTVLEQAYKMDTIQLIDQYAEEDWPPIKVRGRTSRDSVFGYPQAERIKPSDIRKGWYPEVTIVPILPKDDAQRLQMAQVARTPDVRGIPLLSDRTIQDEIIGVDDPDLEQGKINQEWSNSLPVNRLWKAYAACAADGDTVGCQNILTELQRLMGGQLKPPAGAGAKATLGASGQMSLETPGMGMPVEETGMSPSTMPAEMTGGTPPGAANGAEPAAGGY